MTVVIELVVSGCLLLAYVLTSQQDAKRINIWDPSIVLGRNKNRQGLTKRKEEDPNFKSLQVTISSFWDSSHTLFFLSFEDNGVGFSKKDEESLFTKGESHKDNHQGLGLHQTKEVIEKMGGKIVLNSPGKNLGASLIISLPKIMTKD